MSYYDSYLSMVKSPSETYRNQMQAVVEVLFDVSPTIYDDIEEELSFGTLQFRKMTTRITGTIDVKTGERINDDYKKITFSDIYYNPPIGTRYRFNNNIWIVVSTENIKTNTASVYVRRCNNTLNIEDKFGNIHKEPCYVDYSLTETQIFREYSIDIPRGRIEVYCQVNDFTRNIDINLRYMFDGDTYKTRFRKKTDRRNTFDENSIYMMKIQLDYDGLAEDDNQELNVANYVQYNYSVFTEEFISNIIGYTDTLSSKLLLDGKEVTYGTFLWTSSDSNVASINETTGEYEFKNIGTCTITCILKENATIYSTINISVVETIEPTKEYIIFPKVDYIKLGTYQEYTVYEYVNNIKTDTIFDIKSYDAPTDNYYISVGDNSFIIENFKPSDIPVKVICTNLADNTTVETYIKLGGLF